MHRGYIKLWRRIDDNPISKRPAYLSVFLWLSRNANNKARGMIWNNANIIIKRGQLITSSKKIAEGTGVPRGTVERIIIYLKNEEMIEVQANKKFSLITVKNYPKYQPTEEEIEEQLRNKRGTTEEQVVTNKNVKNGKTEKNFTNVKGRSPGVKKKSKPKKRAPPKRAELLPTEPQTMTDEKTRDISFPRTRLYGDERINWLLDYFEYRMERKLSGKELWNRRYANLLMKKVGAGTARAIIDFVANPESWWHKRVFQMQTLYNGAEQLKAQAEEDEKREEFNQLAAKNFT